MTSNIEPVGSGAPPPAASGPVRATPSGDFAATLGAARDAQASSDATVEPSPPPEVQADMAAASRTWHQLAANDRELRFDESAGGRVQVAVHHVSGERLAVLDLDDVYTLIAHERRA